MQPYEELITFARETLALSLTAKIEILPFPTRGSNRKYFRLKWDDHSLILMHYDPSRRENTRFAEIASFLKEIDIPVAEIIRSDSHRCLILMQDLGDTDLWSLRDKPWEVRKVYYLRTLEVACKLHAFPPQQFPSGRIQLMEPFGPSLYQWEHNYCKDQFISRLCGIELDSASLEKLNFELSYLVGKLSLQPKSLVHRDLQSQNVLLYHEKIFLIDFQGMRFGSPFYDLASLLCDPYVNFTEPEREEMLMFYYALAGKSIGWRFFQQAFWEASVQRLMQALGAYAFLGLTHGLKGYRDYIPAGLKNLQIAVERAGSFPQLRKLCSRCEKVLAA